MLMQHGARLLRTKNAVMTPDWVSNEFSIAVYDRMRQEFVWFNRAYCKFREPYNKAIQKSQEENNEEMRTAPQGEIDQNAHNLVYRSWSPTTDAWWEDGDPEAEGKATRSGRKGASGHPAADQASTPRWQGTKHSTIGPKVGILIP